MVHGLNGHRMNTWTQNECFWPRDLLYPKLPNIRVMTFGYNADLAMNYSTLGIKEHATKLLTSLRDEREEHEELERPLIFVCHSLGGIVVKKALLVAAINTEYSAIVKSTQGIEVFMGTPYRGSKVADWSSMVSGIAKVMFLSPPRRLLDDLKTNCKALSDISEDFINIVSRFTIKSFFEENKSIRVITVVDKDSATMKITQEEAIPIEGDHRQIARFSGTDDDRFQAVWKAIRRLIPQDENRKLTPEHKTLLKSLPNSNVYESLNDIEAPCPGTTNWILLHPLFTEWMTSTTADMLNITGKLGSGKSVLSAYLFNHGLREVFKSRLFYFAFRNHSNECSASSAWATLIRQSLTADTLLISKILKQYEQWRMNTEGLGSSFWTPSRLKEAFQMTLLECRYPSVYIIDALDQCDSTMENFVDSFSVLSAPTCRAKVKLLFLCRQGPASLQLSAKLPNLTALDLDEQCA